MHSSLTPCCELAGAHSSLSPPSVSRVAILYLRASATTLHSQYDHKPNFQDGKRLLPVQKNIGPASQFNRLQQPPTEHIGCFPATTYPPQLHDNQRFSPNADAHDLFEENDGDCFNLYVMGENRTAEISRERALDDRPLLLARDGSEHAPHCMNTPFLPTKQKLSAQFKDVLHSKSSLKNVAGSIVPSTKGVSNFDDDNEDDEEQDMHVKPPPTHPLGRDFNRLDFARVYNLVALRVSLAESESLAYRLKGHCLNWPRISNIARVDGDDMDWETQSFLTISKEKRAESIEDSLLRAVYGSVAPPSPLAKRLNAAGKISSRRFKYLESLSRPGRKALKEMRKEVEVYTTKKQSPKKHYMVELEDSQEERVGFETRFESPGFGMQKWIGPFRLLLLDTKYAGQPASKLPMAVQVVLTECEGHRKWGPRREIVPCKLTLFYAYWSIEEILNHLLSQEELMRLTIKIMGHIAVLSLGERHHSVKFLIGKVVLDKHKPKVKTVINKLETVEGNCCPAIEVLAGNHSVVTTIVEDEIPFLVNLATVYWDPELACERHRLIQKFSKKDIVCDVFAGAGPLSLTAAKKVWRVFANDENPEALKYLARNVADNRLQAKVELYNLDRHVFIQKLLTFKSPVLMTQVIFSLPTSGDTILDVFKGAFNRQTWPAMKPLPTIHVYGYSDATNPDRDFFNVIVCKLGLESEMVEVHHVKQKESGRWLVCASFQLPEALAFDD